MALEQMALRNLFYSLDLFTSFSIKGKRSEACIQEILIYNLTLNSNERQTIKIKNYCCPTKVQTLAWLDLTPNPSPKEMGL